MLGIGAALAMSVFAGSEPAYAYQTASSSLQLTLPAPTGPYAIGKVSLHLIDPTRQDPYWSTPHSRELMVSLWYPSRPNWDGTLAPWIPKKALETFRGELADFFWMRVAPPDAPPPPPDGGSPSDGGPPPPASDPEPNPISLDDVRFPKTHAMKGAPVKRFLIGSNGTPASYPVVIFSPGYGLDREQGTALVEDLASHGYVVVTISHTYDSAEVQFPGGRVELGRHDLDALPHVAVALRREDTKFVINKLQVLAAGGNPDAEQRSLPDGLGAHMDLTKIGMFGHSIGGATAVQTMANDQRVIAGIDLDGTVFPDIDPLNSPPEDFAAAMTQLAVNISNRPFMFMTSGGAFGASPEIFFGPAFDSFWGNMSGWRRYVSFLGADHFSYTDNELPLQQCIDAGIVVPPDEFVMIDPLRAVAVERAYILAFFDRWLRNNDNHLLDGASSSYPEILFY